jgi:integrase
VDLPVGLREELATWRARSPRTDRSDPVFVSRARKGRHGRQTERNVQARMRTAVKAANETLAEVGIEPIAASPHSLRRTFASLRAALRDDPVYIGEQGGWTDPRFVLRVYAKAVKRREKLSGEHLVAYDRALEWAGTGREPAPEPVPGSPTGTAPDAGIRTAKLESPPARL